MNPVKKKPLKKIVKLQQTYQQLLHAACADPFAFLGPYLPQEQGALRVWLPNADKVELLLDGQPRIALERDEFDGFILKSDHDLRFTHYQLAVDWAGTEQIIDDPYQYHA